MGIDLAVESVPDATTLLRFRHLLEKQALTRTIFAQINASLEEQGLFMREGTIVDATIIAAAPSTKNQAKQRDPEMHQTKKGNQYYFGLKAHIGVDAASGLTHSVKATAANEIHNGPNAARLIDKFGSPLNKDRALEVSAQTLRLIEQHLDEHGWLALARPTIAECSVFPYLALGWEGGRDA